MNPEEEKEVCFGQLCREVKDSSSCTVDDLLRTLLGLELVLNEKQHDTSTQS
jgi:hypothetical protein